MFGQSNLPTYQTPLLEAFLAALSTVPGAALMLTPHLHLYTAVTGAISPTKAVSDFTEATFNGYAAVVLPTFSGPVNLSSNGGKGLLSSGLFTAGSMIIAPGQTALGYWVDNGSTTVYLAESFAAPYLFVNPGDYLDFTVILPQLYQQKC